MVLQIQGHVLSLRRRGAIKSLKKGFRTEVRMPFSPYYNAYAYNNTYKLIIDFKMFLLMSGLQADFKLNYVLHSGGFLYNIIKYLTIFY